MWRCAGATVLSVQLAVVRLYLRKIEGVASQRHLYDWSKLLERMLIQLSNANFFVTNLGNYACWSKGTLRALMGKLLYCLLLTNQAISGLWPYAFPIVRGSCPLSFALPMLLLWCVRLIFVRLAFPSTLNFVEIGKQTIMRQSLSLRCLLLATSAHFGDLWVRWVIQINWGLIQLGCVLFQTLRPIDILRMSFS